jgi:hypothetical protein
MRDCHLLHICIFCVKLSIDFPAAATLCGTISCRWLSIFICIDSLIIKFYELGARIQRVCACVSCVCLYASRLPLPRYSIPPVHHLSPLLPRHRQRRWTPWRHHCTAWRHCPRCKWHQVRSTKTRQLAGYLIFLSIVTARLTIFFTTINTSFYWNCRFPLLPYPHWTGARARLTS